MNNGAIVQSEKYTITIPAFKNIPQLILDISKIKEGENRFLEAKIVNGATYSDLEYCFNEGYRQAKKHLSTVMYQIAMAKKAIRQVKSEYLLDKYPDFLKENRIKDSTATKEAYLEKKEEYVAALDRLALLNSLECLLEGKVKVFENVCRFMRKEIDLQIRSGNIDKYGRII